MFQLRSSSNHVFVVADELTISGYIEEVSRFRRGLRRSRKVGRNKGAG